MDEIALRRLIGFAVLLLLLLLAAGLLPDAPTSLDPRAEPEAETGVPAARQRVIYDLNAPKPNPVQVRPAPSAIVPVAPAPARVANPRAGWYVQLGTYSTAANARAALTRMSTDGKDWVQEIPPPPNAPPKTATLYRARLGPYLTADEARQVQRLAVAGGFDGAHTIEVR